MITVKKAGLCFSSGQASLVLVYIEDGTGKARRREMPLRELGPTSDPATLVLRLKQRHAHLRRVSDIRLERLARVAQQRLAGLTLADALAAADKALALNPEENLNILSDADLNRKKQIMDLTFEKNNIGKDHPDYVYDKQVEFQPNGNGAGDWDEEEEEEDIKVKCSDEFNQESLVLSAAEASNEDDFW